MSKVGVDGPSSKGVGLVESVDVTCWAALGEYVSLVCVADVAAEYSIDGLMPVADG